SIPPEGIAVQNQGYIKNAWMRLLTAMPSVLENNTFYFSGKGKALSAYKHEVVIPYGQIISNDCKTTYQLRENKGVLNVFANNVYQGNGKLVNFESASDTTLRAEYNINVKTDINHYKWYYYCCAHSPQGGCTRVCRVCKFSNTEQKQDNLVLKDQLSLKYYNPEMKADFEVLDIYSGSTKIRYTPSIASSLDFKDSYFRDYGYIYGLNASKKPYDILTVNAEKHERNENNNLFVEGNETYEIIVKDTSDCSIKLFTHFLNKTIPCNLSYTSVDITIETDKLAYYENETIKVSVKPSKEFNLTYAGKEYKVKDSIELKAVYPYNKISIFYNGRSIDKIIHIKEKESWNILLGFSVFTGMNYFIVILVRKTWGVVM
ncbi:MAG: hypothetical protein NT001_00755, partial [Candidatus Woesearchaeota archaeon]|nr:hypothetical protein [Candidatus Woesearchaeota archaeon]